MGVTKSELFNDRKNMLANMFKVLAHPARLAILQHIKTVAKVRLR